MGTAKIISPLGDLAHQVPTQFHFASRSLEDATTFFDAYFIFSATTEVPIIFHRWSVITGIGALLSRNYWLPFGAKNLYPNMYTLLIGDPGARKSTAITTIQELLATSGYDTFAADKTSKEQFLLDLEYGSVNWSTEVSGGSSGRRAKEGNADAELVMKELFGADALDTVHPMFIVADEFKDFAGTNNLDLSTMLGKLWDNPPYYRSRIKNGKSVSVSQPVVSILGGATHETFASTFPPEAIGTGFLSRLLLIFGESTGKKISWPSIPSSKDLQFIVQWLSKLRETVQGAATVHAHASQALSRIYNEWQPLEDSRFKYYSTRRHIHLLKLCLIISASRLSTTISLEDVILANSILSYTEQRMPRALGEFGRSKNSSIAGRVLAVMYEAGTPLSLPEIFKTVSTEMERFRDLAPLMESLLQANKVIATQQGFLPVALQYRDNQAFVDYSLLPEFYLA